MNKESKIVPIESTTDGFRNQISLMFTKLVDINEYLLAFPPIRGNKGIDDMWMISPDLPEYVNTCCPEFWGPYEYNCELMLNCMHKDMFNERTLPWFKEHLETFAPYSEGARKLLKAIETWKTWGK